VSVRRTESGGVAIAAGVRGLDRQFEAITTTVEDTYLLRYSISAPVQDQPLSEPITMVA